MDHDEAPLLGSNGDEDDPLRSYQHAFPRIRHYDDNDNNERRGNPNTVYHQNWFRGDIHLRPNNGGTNRYDDALFGWALVELLEYLRLTNVLVALASVLLALLTWLFRLIVFQLSKVVLLGYLVVLASILLGSEVTTIWKVPPVDLWLRDHCGWLYHPLSKSFFLYFMGSLCVGLGGWWETLLGLLYGASATVLLVAWSYYPEFRHMYREVEQAAPRRVINQQSWSYYSNSLSDFVKETDATSLLNAFRKQQSSVI